MENLKKNRVIALRKLGVDRKEVEEYRKSIREYLVLYYGTSSEVITPILLAKIGKLAEVRRVMGVEIAGVIFENNLSVTFLFYVDGNPEEAWFERNDFECAEDFEIELNRQTSEKFIPDMSEQKHVIYKYGKEWDIILF